MAAVQEVTAAAAAVAAVFKQYSITCYLKIPPPLIILSRFVPFLAVSWLPNAALISFELFYGNIVLIQSVFISSLTPTNVDGGCSGGSNSRHHH